MGDIPKVEKGQRVRLSNTGAGYLVILVDFEPTLYLHKGEEGSGSWWGRGVAEGVFLKLETDNEAIAASQAKEMGFNVVGR